MTAEYPQVRRRPTRPKAADPQRNSNLVRASVLETALELGFSQNSTVANWIFNNPLSEEAEDLHPEPDSHVKLDAQSEPTPYVAEVITPTLTSGSISTSDESSSLNSPGNNAPSAAIVSVQVHSHKQSVTESPHVHFGDFPSDQLQLFSPFALSSHDVLLPPTDNQGRLAKDAERSRSQDDSLSRDPGHDSPSQGSVDAGYTSEGQYLSKGKVSKGKDKSEKSKGSKNWKPKTSDVSKTSEKDGEYASDGGYLSASSNKSQGKSPGKVKSRAMAFFRRRPKKAARGSDDEDEDNIPPVPAIPILPRPSSPMPLERRAAPSSPARPGFSPLTLNLTSPPASPPRRRVSKSSPPVHMQSTSPKQLDQPTAPRSSASSVFPLLSGPAASTPPATATAFPLPPSMPGTPLSTTFPSTQLAGGVTKSLTASSSRQHLSIPPPTPPPTFPLPELPPSPSVLPGGMAQPLLTGLSRRGAPTRPIPVAPMIPGLTPPLTPRRTASPFRPLLSPKVSSTVVSPSRMGEFLNAPECDHHDGREPGGRQRSATTGLGTTPAFLQRKMQYGPPPSPRHPPPDVPLPPSPYLSLSTHPRTPIAPPSKFHEHFSSISSVPSPPVLSTPTSMSPSPSMAALSESSSGISGRSSHASLVSGRNVEPTIHDPVNLPESSRPTTSASIVSESSYGQPIPSTFGRRAIDSRSRLSDRSDPHSSLYSSMIRRDSNSVITFDDNDADVEDAAPRRRIEADDDASIYTSDDKTAGRRTMYLMEHGELDENEDEDVMTGRHYWDGRVPPLPPLPPMPHRPGPGYF